jgi:hypothetical protein
MGGSESREQSPPPRFFVHVQGWMQCRMLQCTVRWPGIGPFTPLYPGRMEITAARGSGPQSLGSWTHVAKVNQSQMSLLPTFEPSSRADGRVRGLLVARPKGSRLDACSRLDTCSRFDTRCSLQTRYLGAVGTSLLSEPGQAFATQSCRWGARGSRRSKTARSGDEVAATRLRRRRGLWHAAAPRHGNAQSRCHDGQHPALALPAPERLFVARRGGPSVRDAILSHFDSNFHTRLDRDVKCHRPTWSSATAPAWISEQHLRQSPSPMRMHVRVAEEPSRSCFAGIELVNWPSKWVL